VDGIEADLLDLQPLAQGADLYAHGEASRADWNGREIIAVMGDMGRRLDRDLAVIVGEEHGQADFGAAKVRGPEIQPEQLRAEQGEVQLQPVRLELARR